MTFARLETGGGKRCLKTTLDWLCFWPLTCSFLYTVVNDQHKTFGITTHPLTPSRLWRYGLGK